MRAIPHSENLEVKGCLLLYVTAEQPVHAIPSYPMKGSLIIEFGEISVSIILELWLSNGRPGSQADADRDDCRRFVHPWHT